MILNNIKGDIFLEDSELIINPVNLKGVMGKGLALEFKRKYPDMFNEYKNKCYNNEIFIGKNYYYKDKDKWIVNLPTKIDWRDPSEYEYIISGLEDLKTFIIRNNIYNISTPYIGCGLGGLDINKVRDIIIETFHDIDITINLVQF